MDKEKLLVLLAEEREKNRKLLDALMEQLKNPTENICEHCKHEIKCEREKCDRYEKGVGLTDEKGNYCDWDWDCLDITFGTCAMLENTPCNGCFENDFNGFMWKGV